MSESTDSLLIALLKGMFLNCIWMADETMKKKFYEITASRALVDVIPSILPNTKVVSYMDTKIYFTLSDKKYIRDIKLAA